MATILANIGEDWAIFIPTCGHTARPPVCRRQNVSQTLHYFIHAFWSFLVVPLQKFYLMKFVHWDQCDL